MFMACAKVLPMTDHCLGPEELDAVLEGRGTPAQLKHLENCRECRALVAEYRSFLAAEPLDGADPATAGEVLDDLLFRLSASAPEPEHPGLWSRLFGAAVWRPVLIPAAAVLVALFILLPRLDHRPAQPSGVMRGIEKGEVDFRLAQPLLTGSGSWRLKWTSVPEAEGYRVQILDHGLRRISTLEAGAEATGMELDPGQVPADSIGPLFVRVLAVAGGRELDRTPLRELPPRP